MIKIEKVDTENKAQVKRFVQFYYDLYRDCPQFVPGTDIYAELASRGDSFDIIS